jgi:hypothetical protein
MSLNLEQAKKALLINTRAGNATLLRSPSGYGKSTMLMDAFETLRMENAKQGKTTGLGIIFLATQTSPGLIGLPWKGERTWRLPDGTSLPDGRTEITYTVTDPAVPLWMLDVFTGKPATMFHQFVLIIEEYGQGDPEVKRGAAEILLNGGTAPFYLPKGSGRWACTNTGARYGVTKDFLFAISRRTVIDIAQDVDILVNHWDKPYNYQGRQWQMSAVWKAWAKSAGSSVIFETEPKEDNPWCNPRTMSSFDRQYQILKEDNGGRDIDPNDPLLIELGAGTIGMPGTQSCTQFLQFRTQLPSLADVVNDPLNTAVPVKADLQMLMAYELAGGVDASILAPVLAYIQRMNKDMGITFISAVLRRDYKSMINTPAMQAWIAKNSSVVAIVASLANS